MAIYETEPLNYSEEKYNKEINQLKENLKEINEDLNYEIISIEKRLSDKVKYIRFLHKECGEEFHMRKSDFFGKKKQRCPECNSNKKYTLDDVKKIVETNTNNEYSLLSTEIINVKNYIDVRHNGCGKEYPVLLRKFIEGSRCKCKMKQVYENRIKETDDKYSDKILKLTQGEYTKVGNYENHNKPFLVRHNKCGHEWEICGYDFVYNGHRCPKCFHKKSKKETEIANYIKSLGVKIEESFRPNFLNGKEIDIFVPSKNIGFEFNGLYWHSEEGSRGKCNNKYHLNKLELCKNNNVRLIQITEDEWDTKQDIVKSKIKHLLGLHNNKIYARKCYVKEIDSKTRNKFLDDNHIQGKDRCNVSLGLFLKENDKLISIMSFVKPRKALNGNKEYDYELSRFASLKEYNVVGGFSKLFSYFKKNYEWNKLITYADLRWSDGNIYTVNNWNLIHQSKPSYWYINKNSGNFVREYRYKYRKQELKSLFPNLYSDDKSEKQIMQEAGYVRYWDCGNIVFEYKK